MAPVQLSRRDRLSIQFARARRWEFWPGWLFYIPIVIWILICGIRFRHWTAFTAANPGMDNGSVVGERKSRVLMALQAAMPHVVPQTKLLPTNNVGAALNEVQTLAENSGWPVILKPDIGQRGRGVAIIHNRAQAAAYLRKAQLPTLLQSYAQGVEFGVFVRRIPGTPHFEISSVTHKDLPCLQGDGHSALHTLILNHPRARLIAPMLYEKHAGRLHEVLAQGETLQLVELGAHCRGSEFRDAMACITEPLRCEMEHIAKAIPGFAFGRIDLRCPSTVALSRGESLQILEVNGVTSEPAHYYHPGTPLLRGLAGFLEHWTRAFVLGQENLRSGTASAVPPLELLRLFREDLARFDGCEASSEAARQIPNEGDSRC